MAEGKVERKKNKKKNFWCLFLIIFLFGCIFFRTMPSLFAMAFKVVLPENVVIEDVVETKGIIIKKELIHKSDASGQLALKVQEGDRVSKGTLVCSVQFIEHSKNLQQQIRELDEKIAKLKDIEKEKEVFQDKETSHQVEIEKVINQIQENIGTKNYQEVEILKEKLDLYHGRGEEGNSSEYLISTNIENLEKRRDELKRMLEDNTINYYASESGIISYKIDGFEELFSFHNKENYGYGDFDSIKGKSHKGKVEENIKLGDPIFKIIDNFQWYALIKIDNFKELDSLEEGNTILLRNKENQEEFKGTVAKIKKDGNKGTLLCRFNTGFHKIYNERFVDFDIIKYKHNGYKIPSRAIVNNDGIEGVYIKEISGVVKFRPIEILKTDDKFTYINGGDNNYIKLKGQDKPVRTVTKFDEILLNTKTIKEGMIIY